MEKRRIIWLYFAFRDKSTPLKLTISVLLFCSLLQQDPFILSLKAQTQTSRSSWTILKSQGKAWGLPTYTINWTGVLEKTALFLPWTQHITSAQFPIWSRPRSIQCAFRLIIIFRIINGQKQRNGPAAKPYGRYQLVSDNCFIKRAKYKVQFKKTIMYCELFFRQDELFPQHVGVLCRRTNHSSK